MVKVLFVCLGNICRSPMAEAVFNDLVKKEGLEHLIEADSAGTGRWHVGKPPHRGTAAILKENRIDGSYLRARQIIQEDLETYDYIAAMDEENLKAILSMKTPSAKAKVFRLMDTLEEGDRSADGKNVPDPYYTGNFQEVFGMVKAGCQALLEKIKLDHHL